MTDDVKRRLLALWHKRGEATGRNNGERPSDHVPLYFTLARMGLKDEAGRVDLALRKRNEQRGWWMETHAEGQAAVTDG